MTISDRDRLAAEAAMQTELKDRPRAVRARYDHQVARIVIDLDNGLELTFLPRLAEGLEKATPAELATIEITPLGDGLHWPAIDADLYVPALLQAFGLQESDGSSTRTIELIRRSRAPDYIC